MPLIDQFTPICCCCCNKKNGKVNGTGAGIPGNIPPFNTEETSEILASFRRWTGQTGRNCEDFFETIRQNPEAEPGLTGRQTIIGRINRLTPTEERNASATLCVLTEEAERTRPRAQRERERRPPVSACPFLVRSAFGPAAVRSTAGLGCHNTEGSARVGLRIFLRNNPGLSGRIESEEGGVIQEETTKV